MKSHAALKQLMVAKLKFLYRFFNFLFDLLWNFAATTMLSVLYVPLDTLFKHSILGHAISFVPDGI
jgi:hypothetical protein